VPQLPAPTSDIASLVARLLLGIVLVAHGWQKLAEKGIAATSAGFAGMGIPAPGAAAVFATFVELGGGVLILVGLATPYVAVLTTLNMIGAGLFAGHWTGGVFVAKGGWELVGVIITGALMLLAFGPGRVSIDHLLAARRRAKEPVGRHVRVEERVRVLS
jgi:putative oxidoreductase